MNRSTDGAAVTKETTHMGNFHIGITGVGMHHNADPNDAEQLTRKFVEQLRKAGHNVVTATVHTGGETQVIDRPAAPANILPDTGRRIVKVNGKDVDTTAATLTYERACALAWENPAFNPSVTVKNPGAEGVILSPGSGEVSLAPGAVINVQRTGNA